MTRQERRRRRAELISVSTAIYGSKHTTVLDAVTDAGVLIEICDAKMEGMERERSDKNAGPGGPRGEAAKVDEG